ncbi:MULTISPECIES: hypothetical protein [Moorena]|uniref:hypothetical protein n=1 Tax=Moorena TaxID=1155738 RepID=UPI001056283A|nr:MULTISPECIES: hypothetical protein [Moorena]NEP31016.1 hypothetical protein [Moorena sp. SIO3B2]NEQ04548.1 hypothetical protein [Moorena sp. SIO4E2]NEQ16168.1 hypothetical protein [Moorena sp. SIO3E2]NER88279.1 hypothetical protein [Moorena sp. SIO3A2]
MANLITGQAHRGSREVRRRNFGIDNSNAAVFNNTKKSSKLFPTAPNAPRVAHGLSPCSLLPFTSILCSQLKYKYLIH